MSDETRDLFDNEDEGAEEGNTIILTDADGNEVEFEHLDTIEYEEDVFVVLIESVEDDGVIILKLVEGEEEDGDELVTVEDVDVLDAVYELFKERNKDFFEFED